MSQSDSLIFAHRTHGGSRQARSRTPTKPRHRARLLALAFLAICTTPTVHADLKGWLKDQADRVRDAAEGAVRGREEPRQERTEPTPAESRQPAQESALSRAETRELQQLLNTMGYPAGTADGFAGGKTRQAISAFQAALTLDIDGKPSKETLGAARVMVASHRAAPIANSQISTSAPENQAAPRTAQAEPTGEPLLTPTQASETGVATADDGDNLLAPTAASTTGAAAPNPSSRLIAEANVIPGNDLFRPLTMLVRDGVPLLRQSRASKKGRLTMNEALYLRLLDIKAPGRSVNFTDRSRDPFPDMELYAVRDDKLSRYGTCVTSPGKPRRCFIGQSQFGGDEFALRRARQAFDNEVPTRFEAWKPAAPRTLYWGWSEMLARYDFESETQYFAGSEPSRRDLARGRVPSNYRLDRWGYHAPVGLSLSPEEAERFRKELERLVPRPAYAKIEKPEIYGLARVSIDRSGQASIERVDYYATDAYQHRLASVPVVSKAERTQLAERRSAEHQAHQQSAAANAQAEQELAAVEARAQQVAEFPQRQFDVVGVRLGMDIGQARLVLEAANYVVKELDSPRTTGFAYGVAGCREQVTALIAQAKSEGITGASLDPYVLKRANQLDPECSTRVRSPLRVVLSATKTYGSRTSETISVEISGRTADASTVRGIARTIKDGEGALEFTAGLQEKFGGESIRSRGSSRDVWFSDGARHFAALESVEFEQSCVSRRVMPMSSGTTVRADAFLKDCGPLLVSAQGRNAGRSSSHRLVLVDTAHTAAAYAEIARELEIQQAATPKVTF